MVVERSESALIGHGWALDLARRMRAAERSAHSLLLTGHPHVGKFTTALAMAGVFLCAEGRGCGTCRNCRLVARRVHPDLRILELPPDRRTIPIKDVHELLQGVALRPLEAARKVYIVRDADDLAEEGSNALLKTLEEPPPSVTMILTAPEPGTLLETIVSRCQLVRLHAAPLDEIRAYLVSRYGLDEGRADTVARASAGRPGWAIMAAEQPELVDGRRQRALDLLALLDGTRLERLQAADTLAARWTGHVEEVQDVLEVWAEVWRDLLLVQEGLGDRVRAPDLAEQLGRAAALLAPEAVRDALQKTLEVAAALKGNANPRLALEGYTLLLPRLRAAGL